ncbi:MAG: IS66 family transposase [Candidatus Binatia bacterium]
MACHGFEAALPLGRVWTLPTAVVSSLCAVSDGSRFFFALMLWFMLLTVNQGLFDRQADAEMVPNEVLAAIVTVQATIPPEARNAELQRQTEWFKRQLFGRKSERRLLTPDAHQLPLAGILASREEAAAKPPSPTETVTAYRRHTRFSALPDAGEEGGLRFDGSVPMRVIAVPTPEVADLAPDAYEVIGEKVTYRLAQHPGAYVVLKYVRQVIKLKATEQICCPPVPPAVFEKSLADVRLLAGLLIDKFAYHLPLYRQHQRLAHAGITLNRGTLTQWVHRTADLLTPTYHALLSSILQSHVLTMDETPIKAGHKSKGKLQTGYFWPIYGDQDEIAFPFAVTRAERVVHEVLGAFCGVLVTDGYKVYDRFVRSGQAIVHAQCWAHTRRKFIEAQTAEPELVAQALEQIGTLYAFEAQGQEQKVTGDAKLRYRRASAQPIVAQFFTWLEHVVRDTVLLPTNPFRQAAHYALERRSALSIFLADPTVPIDTNHLERQIRPLALGRRNWLFCWTEVGARYVGIVQSLLASCRLHGLDPYVYLVDVLQRIDTHPAFDVHLLTPRLWKQHFAHNPLRSALDRCRQ